MIEAAGKFTKRYEPIRFNKLETLLRKLLLPKVQGFVSILKEEDAKVKSSYFSTDKPSILTYQGVERSKTWFAHGKGGHGYFNQNLFLQYVGAKQVRYENRN